MTHQITIHQPGDHVWTMSDSGVVHAFIVLPDGTLQERDTTAALLGDKPAGLGFGPPPEHLPYDPEPRPAENWLRKGSGTKADPYVVYRDDQPV